MPQFFSRLLSCLSDTDHAWGRDGGRVLQLTSILKRTVSQSHAMRNERHRLHISGMKKHLPALSDGSVFTPVAVCTRSLHSICKSHTSLVLIIQTLLPFYRCKFTLTSQTATVRITSTPKHHSITFLGGQAL